MANDAAIPREGFREANGPLLIVHKNETEKKKDR